VDSHEYADGNDKGQQTAESATHPFEYSFLKSNS